ncbi:MAG: sigma-E processing peptidase SpoIIGA [Clostridia bacterium]|nr:sigma-E processing peptidase SpoIIGA [Clostridia bacterium]
MTVIYIDILLALNLFIDYVLLLSTARVLRLPTSKGRLIGAALIGALSTLWILFPFAQGWLSTLWKLASAAAMVRAAFRFQGWRAFGKQTVTLFLISALFCGLCYAAWTLLSPPGLLVQNGIVYFDVPPLTLLLLTCLSYGGLCVFEHLTRKRAAKGRRYRVEILDDDLCVLLEAMYDSGHSLCDSFSGAPVILVKEKAVRRLQPLYSLSSDARPPGNVRFIPYQSIGGDGVLAAFRPSRVTLYADDRAVDISGVWIAPTTALRRDEYDALIGAALTDLVP